MASQSMAPQIVAHRLWLDHTLNCRFSQTSAREPPGTQRGHPGQEHFRGWQHRLNLDANKIAPPPDLCYNSITFDERNFL
jgi:hypothetical protein